MGSCESTKKHSKEKQRNYLRKKTASLKINNENNFKLYSLNTSLFRSKVDFSKIDSSINVTFSFSLSKLKCLNLSSISNIYKILIEFPLHNEPFTAIAEGNAPSFNINPKLTLTFPFKQLSSHFILISLYTLKAPRKSSGGNVDIEQLINNNYTKLIWYAGIKIDLLTIVLGPKLYDVQLVNNNVIENGSSNIGTISFRIESVHLGSVNISSSDVVMELYRDKISDIDNIKKVFIQPNTNVMNVNVKTFARQAKPFVLIRDDNSKNKHKCLFIKQKKDSNESKNITIESSLINFFITNVYNMIYKGTNDSNNSNIHTLMGYFFQKMSVILQDTIHSIYMQMTNLFNIFQKEPFSEIIQYIPYYEYSSKIELDILYKGQLIGKMLTHNTIQNIPGIIQFPYGIFTEKGIFFHNFSLFRFYSSSHGKQASYSNIKQRLIEIYESLQSKITEAKNKHQSNPKEPLEYTRISGELNEIKDLFDESISPENKLYYYKHKDDIYHAQGMMLDIGNFIFSIIDKISQCDIMTAFDIFQLVSERDEFEQYIIREYWLNYDNKTNTSTFKQEIIKKQLIDKLFLFQRNTIAFSKFSDDSPEDDNNKKIPQSRLYLNKLMSINFFRIEAFRKNLIKSLFKRAKYTSEERIEYLKYDKDKIDYYPESKVLYWNLYLSKSIFDAMKQFSLENETAKTIIDEIKKRSSTQQISFVELSRKDTFNFDLIKKILQLTVDKLTKENPKHFFNWLSISSFPNLINAILYEISNKQISQYPSNLIEVITFFAHHQHIINTFLHIIISKTNVYETSSVYFVLDLLHALFTEHINKMQTVYNVDYTLLYNAFNVIANVDNCLNITKMLWMYYTYGHVMPNYHIIDMVLGVFIPKFFLFSFHWSWKIRKIWFVLLKYVLLYRFNEKIKYDDVYKQNKEITIYEEDEHGKRSFSELFEKEMKVINDIKAVYLSNNGTFDVNCKSNVMLIEGNVDKELWSNIECAIKEYLKIEKEFKQWKVRKVGETGQMYPIVVIPPIKDDIDI